MFDFSLQQLLLRFAAILVVVPVHGYVQALVAQRLGDSGPKYDGRLTLNPLAHLDAMGALGLLFFSLGWIKPIKLDTAELRVPRRDLVIIVLASLLANIALALLLRALRPWVFTTLGGSAAFTVLAFMNTTIELNIWFAVFNLLPIPPLTGMHFLSALAPATWARLNRYLIYGRVTLAIAILTGFAARILSPGVRLLSNMVGG